MSEPLYLLRLLPRHGQVRLIKVSHDFDALQKKALTMLVEEGRMAQSDYKANHKADPEMWDEPPDQNCYLVTGWKQSEISEYTRIHDPVVKNRWVVIKHCDKDEKCRGFCNYYDIVELNVE